MTPSIRSRFGFSLFANITKSAISFCSGMLVARSLGPDEYGSMMFLLGTFTAMRQLLDMGSSKAFFTFVSQRQRSRKFVGYYFVWLGIQFLIPLLAVGFLFPDLWVEFIWRGEQRPLVLLSFIAVFMQSILWSALLQLGESQRLTHTVQSATLAIAIVHFSLLFLAWRGGWLQISAIFTMIIIEWGLAAVWVASHLKYSAKGSESDSWNSVIREFWLYCFPLIPYAWMGFVYEFLDRWLLQIYAGSVQQAYYSIAYQFGAIAAIATSSILNIFWKEIAEAHEQNNFEKVAELYKKVSRGLFFVAAAGAGFLMPWAEEILSVTVGTAYASGATTLSIMFFYPLHQSLGQINGALAYATGRVTMFVKIGLVFMIVSTFITYFVLASTNAFLPGLGLGSVGLAGKMVLMQIISVSVLTYYLAKSLRMEIYWLFQPATVLICTGLGFFAYFVSNMIFDSEQYSGLAFLFAGLLYFILVSFLIGIVPNLAGLSRIQILSTIQLGRKLFD